MKLITQEQLCYNVAERWKNQYFDAKWASVISGNSKIIYDQLVALGDHPKPKDIDRIIGNDSWTTVPTCDKCGKKSKTIIEFCENADYDAPHAYICKKCLNKALMLMEAE